MDRSGYEPALLKAIASRPDDDLPRLVYADWLDEHGRPERAAFIRLQVQDERPMTGRDRKDTEARIKALLGAHRAAWLRELPRWARQWYEARSWRQLPYRRGFPDEVDVCASHFLAFGDRLLDRLPVTAVQLDELRAVRGGLATCPWLGRVRRLMLDCEELGEEGAAALAENRRLGRVKVLSLRYCRLGDAGARALAGARSLTALRVLDLRDNDLTLGGAKALARSRFAASLGALDLRDNLRLDRHRYEVERLFGARATL